VPVATMPSPSWELTNCPMRVSKSRCVRYVLLHHHIVQRQGVGHPAVALPQVRLKQRALVALGPLERGSTR
jgi:hypothetical protein